MEIIFESSSCKATYISEKKRIFFEFFGYANFEQAVEMYTIVLNFMKTHKVVSFFNDLREIKGTFTKITKWIFENIMEVVDLGLKYDALVLNNDVFAEFAAQDLASRIQIIDFQIFRSMTDAEEWLSERENAK